jgi:hypothetical protein
MVADCRTSDGTGTELLRDIRIGTEQIEAGEGISNRAARAELRKRLGL